MFWVVLSFLILFLSFLAGDLDDDNGDDEDMLTCILTCITDMRLQRADVLR